MRINKDFCFALIIIFSITGHPLFGRTIKSTEWQNNPEVRMRQALHKRSSSFTLPNWTDTILGFSCGLSIFLGQKRYLPDFAVIMQEFFFQNSIHKEWIKNCFLLLPATLVGAWVFFELRQITSSGLYDRAKTILTNLNFKCVDQEFSSTYEFFQYLTHQASAKELRIINDEFNYVMTHKFFSKILNDLTYALRLLERSHYWSTDSIFLAEVDSLMYAIRAKIRCVTHNKILFEHDMQYSIQLAEYQQQQHLAHQDRITDTVESQHAFAKLKFTLKTIGKVINFLFGRAPSNH